MAKKEGDEEVVDEGAEQEDDQPEAKAKVPKAKPKLAHVYEKAGTTSTPTPRQTMTIIRSDVALRSG